MRLVSRSKRTGLIYKTPTPHRSCAGHDRSPGAPFCCGYRNRRALPTQHHDRVVCNEGCAGTPTDAKEQPHRRAAATQLDAADRRLTCVGRLLTVLQRVAHYPLKACGCHAAGEVVRAGTVNTHFFKTVEIHKLAHRFGKGKH